MDNSITICDFIYIICKNRNKIKYNINKIWLSVLVKYYDRIKVELPLKKNSIKIGVIVIK